MLRAYRVLGCRDWSRIDVRLDASGTPNIVEVNPLPGILPNPDDNSCLPKAARAAGISYDELIQSALRHAAERNGIALRRVARQPRRDGPRSLRPRPRRMKVAILFDGASAYATKPDQLILSTVEAIEKSLVAEGNTVGYIPVYHDGKWIEKLRRGKFDLAFNMCEGIDGIATLESSVISVLELFKIPFTGASSYTTSALPPQARHQRAARTCRPADPQLRRDPSRRPARQRRLPGDRQAGGRRRVARRRAALGRAQHAPARRARRSDARACGTKCSSSATSTAAR